TGDVTERATRYAQFNADLNGLGNVRAVQGDMYEPVRGLTFDRIVAHPPYIASPEQTMIYRDGGPDGEQFTRALLAGLPEFLEPGGRFYMTCVATDRTEGPFEQRIRRMIGPSNDEFDVVLAVRVARDPADYFRAVARAGQSSQEDADAKIAAYQAMGAEKLVYASMAIERHASPRTPFTARRSCGTAQLGESLDWELDWVRNRASPGFAARLLDCRVLGRNRSDPHALHGIDRRARAGARAGRRWAGRCGRRRGSDRVARLIFCERRLPRNGAAAPAGGGRVNAVACRANSGECVAEYKQIAPYDTSCAAKMCFLDTRPIGPYDRRVGLQSVMGVAKSAARTSPLAPGLPSAVIGLHSSVPAFFNSLDF